MAGLPLTAFDVAVLVVIGLSVLISLMRGVTREALGIASWAGASVVAWYGFGYARELAQATIETDWLADAAAFGLVFVVPLVAFKLIAAMLVDRLPGGSFGVLDRTLGMAFGALRGAVIVCAVYLGLSLALAPDEQPEWIRNALVLPYVQDGAGLLQRYVPDDLTERTRGAAAAARQQSETLGELRRTASELTSE
jgi:membrane protein required for colicin V production